MIGILHAASGAICERYCFRYLELRIILNARSKMSVNNNSFDFADLNSKIVYSESSV